MNHLVSKIMAGLGLFALLTLPAGAQRQQLQGQVPAAVAAFHLQPVDELPGTNRLQFAIVLPPRNLPALGQFVKDVYNRFSANYHHYLTPDQYNEQFGPAATDYQAVLDFAGTNGWRVTGTHPGRSLVEFEAAVGDLEKALHVRLLRYRHPAENRLFFAPAGAPALDLAVPIQAICGLDNYVLPQAKSRIGDLTMATSKAGSYNDSTNGNLFMGADFRHAYVPDTQLNGAGQAVGLQEFDGYNPRDISAYEATANLPNVPVQYVPVDNKSNDLGDGDIEPPLDIEMVISMAPNVEKVVFYDGKFIDSILTEMTDPKQGEPLPLQISSSWGYGTDTGTSNLMMRLAAQGQSYFYAMGDEGALPVDPNGLNGTYTNGADASDLEPYMTTVGGTSLFMSGVGQAWTNEIVWGENGPKGGPGGSAGGILTTVPIPDYQKPVNMSANGGSTTQCNVPDVALTANQVLSVSSTNIAGVYHQHYVYTLGTSCAAPLWAGFAALVNQQAAAAGKPSLGFCTPALYNIGLSSTYTACFHDITSGNNTWSNSPSAYFARPGYDLCTGWGTPAGASLINALITVANPQFVDFHYTGSVQNGSYYKPFSTLAQGINAVSNYGSIFILNGGSSDPTPSLTKPMTLTAQNGAATIVH